MMFYKYLGCASHRGDAIMFHVEHYLTKTQGGRYGTPFNWPAPE